MLDNFFVAYATVSRSFIAEQHVNEVKVVTIVDVSKDDVICHFWLLFSKYVTNLQFREGLIRESCFARVVVTFSVGMFFIFFNVEYLSVADIEFSDSCWLRVCCGDALFFQYSNRLVSIISNH